MLTYCRARFENIMPKRDGRCIKIPPLPAREPLGDLQIAGVDIPCLAYPSQNRAVVFSDFVPPTSLKGINWPLPQKLRWTSCAFTRQLVATPEFSDRMARLLSDSFAREPMSAAVDFSPEELVPFFARFMPEGTTNGLSVVATPVDRPEALAGVFLCRDFKSPFPAGILEEVPRFAPIAHALDTVDRAYELQRPGLALGDGVGPFRGCGEPRRPISAKRHCERPLSRLC